VTTTLDLDFTITTTLDPRITFSRTSLATYYGSDGLLKYAAHNFALQSQTFDNASWAKQSGATVTADNTTAPDSTATADRLNHVTAGTVVGGGVNQTLPQPPNRAVFSVYAKAGTKNWISIGTTTLTLSTYAFFNLGTGVVGTKGSGWVSIGIQSVGGGWYRCYGELATVTAILIRVAEVDGTLNCTSPGDIYTWGAQFEHVTTATTPSTYMPTTTAAVHGPRFDYDPVTHVAKGLLIEGANNNRVLQTQDFSNANWTKTGMTASANQAAAPDATTTANLITAAAASAYFNQPTSSVEIAPGTISIFAKRGTSDWFYFNFAMTGDAAAPTGPAVWFNLATGVVGTIDAAYSGALIESVGNGWYRCQITRTVSTSAPGWRLGLCDADNSTTVTIGRTIYLWGAQTDNSASGATRASSYIPAAASTNARAADIAVMTGSNFSDWYNAAAGTFVAEFALLTTSGTRSIISADGGSTAEQILLYGSGTDPKAMVRDGNVTQADIDAGTIAAGTTYKLGVSFAANDIAACLNGGTVGTDASATMPTPTQLRLGSDGTNYLNGWIAHLQFQNTALDDTALQTLTTPGAWSGGEPVPPAVGPTTTGGAAFWDQDYDGREYESSRKRRKRFLEERARRVREL
jgi:hypothetical protein